MTDEVIDIDSVTPDAANVRQRTQRSAEVIGNSLRQFGAARWIVLDADGIVRAGSRPDICETRTLHATAMAHSCPGRVIETAAR